jgi:hypothetical protein
MQPPAIQWTWSLYSCTQTRGLLPFADVSTFCARGVMEVPGCLCGHNRLLILSTSPCGTSPTHHRYITGVGDGLAEPVGIWLGKHKYKTRSCFSPRRYTRSWEGSARCAFSDRNLHSRMPLVPTPARLNEPSRRVTNAIPLGCPLFLPVELRFTL